LAEITASPNLVVRLYPAAELDVNFNGEIISFTNPDSITTTTANNIFTLTCPKTLAANTTYWLVVEILSGSGQYIWAATTSDNQSGSLGWSIRDNNPLYDPLYSLNQGLTWQLFPERITFQFKVTGAQTP
jgi:hypothetical protein